MFFSSLGPLSYERNCSTQKYLNWDISPPSSIYLGKRAEGVQSTDHGQMIKCHRLIYYLICPKSYAFFFLDLRLEAILWGVVTQRCGNGLQMFCFQYKFEDKVGISCRSSGSDSKSRCRSVFVKCISESIFSSRVSFLVDVLRIDRVLRDEYFFVLDIARNAPT